MLLWERLRPFRHFQQKKSQRFRINLSMMLLNFAILRIFSGGGAFFAAEYAANAQLGIFNQYDFPTGFEFIAGLVVLDIAIYFQHRLLHVIPLFWRFHKVHHSDLGFDTTTAVRFHAVEILFSMYYKIVLVLLLGTSPTVVMTFEIILNACALFNHGNVRIPQSLEKAVRKIVITPDMHRIHHSAAPKETNSNYGFSVPWWDWIFGSYRNEPALTQDKMVVGINDRKTLTPLGFINLLALPFAHRKTESESS